MLLGCFGDFPSSVPCDETTRCEAGRFCRAGACVAGTSDGARVDSAVPADASADAIPDVDPMDRGVDRFDSEVEGDASPDSEVEGDASPDSEVEVDASPDSEVEPDATPDGEVEPDASPDSEVEPDATPDSEVEPDAAVVDAASDLPIDSGPPAPPCTPRPAPICSGPNESRGRGPSTTSSSPGPWRR